MEGAPMPGLARQKGHLDLTAPMGGEDMMGLLEF